MTNRIAIGAVGALIVISVMFSGICSCTFHFSIGGHRFTAQLSHFALAMWLLAVLVVALSWRIRSATDATINDAKWPRVLLAFLVDIVLYYIVVVVPLCLLALWLESRAVGEFAWQFSREFGRSTDVITIATAHALIIIFWASPGIPLWARRESPGGLLVGVALKLSSPVPLWRCAVFGLFKYVGLALLVFASFFKSVGGFHAGAVTTYGKRTSELDH